MVRDMNMSTMFMSGRYWRMGEVAWLRDGLGDHMHPKCWHCQNWVDPPTPHSWHLGEFGQQKRINATRNIFWQKWIIFLARGRPPHLGKGFGEHFAMHSLPSTAPTFNKQRGFAPDGRSSGRSDALRCSLSTPDSHSRCLCHHIHQKGLSMISWPIEWFLLNSSFRCGTIPALANIALFILLLFAGLSNTCQ